MTNTSSNNIKFNVEVNYQPINQMYGCKIEEGNTTIFEVDADPIVCATNALKRYIVIGFPSITPTKTDKQ